MAWRADFSARAIVAILAITALSACAGMAGSPGPRASTGPGTHPTANYLKPPLQGLLDRNEPPSGGYVAVMGGYVVNVHWSDIQAAEGGPIAADNTIDRAITQVRRLDPRGRIGLKIRLFAGVWAPDWAKALEGGPIPVHDPVTGASGTVGPWWSSDFGRAYQDLQNKLAAKYDDVPEVREVTISRCTSVYAEPFIRDVADRATVQALLAAGFTDAADERCEQDQVRAHLVWARTRSDLALNPYQRLSADRSRPDEQFTEQVMEFCRAALGLRCLLENNSLRTPPLAAYGPMYERMRELGPPISFQTAVAAKAGDLGQTVSYAVELGANSVELPAGYQNLSVSELQSLDASLKANPTG